MRCAGCGQDNPTGSRFCNGCGQPLEAMEHPRSFADGRYAVVRLLGEGARKRVWLARDSRLGRDVAIAEHRGADDVDRLLTEARETAQLGSHPNLVAVYDVFEESGRPVVVSEYVDAGTLEGRGPLPQDEARRIAAEIADALVHAHANGIIHRDIKPANVFMTAAGTAKLGDFGLAAPSGTSDGFSGSAAYMAPEQAAGTADVRSDLYSLGVLLYELLCGRQPFEGDAAAVVAQHAGRDADPPSRLNPDILPSVDAIVLKLLAKDPDRRFASAADVASALRSEGERPVAPTRVAARLFVGRAAELAQLAKAFDEASAGRGSLVMVVGEPGIGKTSVCTEVIDLAAASGGRGLIGHCYEEGSLQLPYIAFVEVLRAWQSELDDDVLRMALSSSAPWVSRIVPDIGDRLGLGLLPEHDPEEQRYRLLLAVTETLRRAAETAPLVIVLEDLHDADRGTLDQLIYLARHLDGSRILLIGTYRDVEVDRTHPLSSALAELRRAASYARVQLRGLSIEDVSSLLDGIVGQKVPPALAEAVFKQTEGNPLFVQEVARHVAEEGITTAGSLAIPEGLRDVIGKRLSRLGSDCNRVLQVAAVIGREFDLDVLASVAAMDEDQLVVAVEEGVRAGVLEEPTGRARARFQFAHAFFRQTLYEELIAPRRIRLHQEVARALEHRYANRLDEHAAELAEHFSYSSDPDDLRRAVEYGAAAARRASEVFAHGEAARLFGHALQVLEEADPGDETGRCDLLLALGSTLLPAGEPQRLAEEIAPLAFEIAERLNDPARASRACQLALGSLNALYAGGAYRTPEYAEWAARADQFAKPETADRVRADVALAISQPVPRPGEHDPLLDAFELAKRVADPDALFEAAMQVVNSRRNAEHLDRQRRVAKELAQYPRHGVSPRVLSFGLAMCSDTLLDHGDREASEAIAVELDGLAELTRDAFILPLAISRSAVLAFVDGRLEDAAEKRRQALTLFDSTGRRMAGRVITITSSRAEFLLGTVTEEDAREDWGIIEEFRETRSSRQALGPGSLMEARLLAHFGRAEEARKAIRTAIAQLQPDDPDVIRAMYVRSLEVAVALRESDAVAVLTPIVEPFADLALGGRSGITISRVLGAAARLIGDGDLARERYRHALEVAGRIRFRPEQALTHLELAELCASTGDSIDALEHLEIALPELRDMKMNPALERAISLRVRVLGVEDASSSIDLVSARVQSERPDVPIQSADGTVTIAFTDIEDSTVLNERMGDAAWFDVLKAHNRAVRTAVAEHGGFEVKHEGDGFMLAFPSADSALACAVNIQRSLVDAAVRVRIGLHRGPAIRDADDFFGRTVNLAARVAKTAAGREVLVSEDIRDAASEFQRHFDAPREVELKGFAGIHRLYRVLWDTA